MRSVRPAAVAGLFYPARRAQLAGEVARLIESARVPSANPLKAIVAPHAGYVYSGAVAASAYASVAAARARIARVVLLGPAHRVALRGLALPGACAFSTPLGVVEIDQASLDLLASLQTVGEQAAAHVDEHCLEVQLPFLQHLLGEFSLVPLLVGAATPQQVATVLDALWGGDETLIVVSSDLSHYLGYTQARAIDARTARAITALQPDIGHDQACGATPVNGLLLTARRRAMQAALLDLRNSGDTAGDKACVVGYGAFGFGHSAADAWPG